MKKTMFSVILPVVLFWGSVNALVAQDCPVPIQKSDTRLTNCLVPMNTGLDSRIMCVDSKIIIAGSQLVCLSGHAIQNKLWEAKIDCAGFPFIADGKIYVAGKNKTMNCLELETGKMIWTAKLKGQTWNSPVVCDGKVLFGSQDKNFNALSAADGSVAWTFAGKGPYYAQPVASEGRIYTANEDKKMQCFDISKGTLVWETDLKQKPGSSSIILSADSLYIVCAGFMVSHAFRIDKATGNIMWNKDTGSVSDVHPVLMNGKLFYNSREAVYCRDIATGNQIWSATVKANDITTLKPLEVSRDGGLVLAGTNLFFANVWATKSENTASSSTPQKISKHVWYMFMSPSTGEIKGGSGSMIMDKNYDSDSKIYPCIVDNTFLVTFDGRGLEFVHLWAVNQNNVWGLSSAAAQTIEGTEFK